MTAFTFVFLAELGDKTQLTAIMLSSKASAVSVFAGSMSAFFLVDGLSVLIGGELFRNLPSQWVSLISGLVFIFYGFFSIFHREGKIEIKKQKVTFLKAFSMICLMELGDKTQIASVFLAAELKSPLIVLMGVVLAFSLVTGIGVIFGAKLLGLLPEKYVRKGTLLLFIFFGFIFILDAITDTGLFVFSPLSPGNVSTLSMQYAANVFQ
ncbi:MAG: TMEM165/GDT1 family protein [Candidatus Bathyarchaeia archaeon]